PSYPLNITLSTHHTCFLSKHPATPEIYTLSLHDALPISGAQRDAGQMAERGRHDRHRRPRLRRAALSRPFAGLGGLRQQGTALRDRKSTRLNSSHVKISYAVFCLKKKTKKNNKSITLSPN